MRTCWLVLILLTSCVTCLTACQTGGRTIYTPPVNITFVNNTPEVSRQGFLPTLTASLPVLSQPTPQPNLTPFIGWLVFSRREDTNKDGVIDQEDGRHLYIMDLTTKVSRQVTTGSYNDISPSWSPDRNRIVFASDRSGRDDFDLFVINADGSELVQLTHTPMVDEIEPAWSPNGATIAYVERFFFPHRGSEYRLSLISADGKETRRLTEGPNDTSPAWSPDGRFLAFEREELIKVGQSQESILLSQIYLWDSQTEVFIHLNLPVRTDLSIVEYGYPRWLPRQGWYLSLVRCEISADTIDWMGIVIFDVQEERGEIVLHQLPVKIESNYIHFAWGFNGEWLIAPVQVGESFNLLRARVRLTGESQACWQCTGVLDEEFLTVGNFLDDFPNWLP